VAENLEHLVHFRFPTENGRDLILPRELVEIRGEMLEERRQFEPLLEPLFAELVVAHPRGKTGDERFGLDAVTPDDRDRNALRFLENRGEKIGCLNHVPAGSARMQQRELKQEPRRGGHPQVTTRDARQQAEVLFERLKDLVRVQAEIAHDLPEHVPLDLGKRQTDMLIRQHRVVAAARLF
jgi:hypothetical protein